MRLSRKSKEILGKGFAVGTLSVLGLTACGGGSVGATPNTTATQECSATLDSFKVMQSGGPTGQTAENTSGQCVDVFEAKTGGGIIGGLSGDTSARFIVECAEPQRPDQLRVSNIDGSMKGDVTMGLTAVKEFFQYDAITPIPGCLNN
jgi:hypothetical protein